MNSFSNDLRPDSTISQRRFVGSSAIVPAFIVWMALGIALSSVPSNGIANEIPFDVEFPIRARDSLDIGEEDSEDARQCLETLTWEPGEFDVTCEDSPDEACDVIVRFPSPVVTGNAKNDNVAVEWYFARDDDGNVIEAPAIVVVHESGSGMGVGRLIARSLSHHNFHAFMIQLPGYGKRRDRRGESGDAQLVNLTHQAVADVRRVRDAVEVLPMVDATHIGLQGTSLGGFVSATAAGLDGCYDSVHLMLAGGNLFDVIQNGKHDAAEFKRLFAEAGYTGDALRKLLLPVEPNRLAHRLDPNRTWLYTGKHDTVVPPENSNSFAKSASLPDTHHIRLNCDHYSGAIYLPFVLQNMEKRVRSLCEQE